MKVICSNTTCKNNYKGRCSKKEICINLNKQCEFYKEFVYKEPPRYEAGEAGYIASIDR